MKIFFMMIFAIYCAKSFAVDNLQYKDVETMRGLEVTFCKLQHALGALVSIPVLNQDEADEVNKLVGKYNILKEKYKSNQMNMYAWGGEQRCINEGKSAMELFRDSGIKNYEIRKKESDEIMSGVKGVYDGFEPTLSIRQCAYKKQYNKDGSMSSVWNTSIVGDIIGEINGYLSRAIQDIYYLEWRLPRKVSEGTLLMTSKARKEIQRNDSLCLEPIKDEKGWRLEPRRKDIKAVSVVEAKERIAPYSKSRKSMDETTCRNLSDPRIPPPPGVQCVFNYK